MRSEPRWKNYPDIVRNLGKRVWTLFKRRMNSSCPNTTNQTLPINKSISGRRRFLKQSLLRLLGAIAVVTFPQQTLAVLDRKKTAEQFPEDLLYHKRSILSTEGMLGTGSFPSSPPPLYKNYPNVKKIPLPDFTDKDLTGVEKVIRRRRSIRQFSQSKLTLLELSRILQSAAGITERRRGFRAAPSAGATYPIEIYCIVNNVDGLAQGIYHYEVNQQALALIKSGDFSSKIMQSALYQKFVGKANVVIVLTAIFNRTRWRYKERAYRYILIEAGHIGENIYLTATALGLSPCAVGAFMDTRVNALLELNDWHEQAIYLLTIGK